MHHGGQYKGQNRISVRVSGTSLFFGDRPEIRANEKYGPNFWSLLTTYGCMMVNLTTGKTERPLQNPMYGIIMA